ncbi:class-II fumarase/aspartase family protein [Streptomyces albireticuli]|uniref:class-II fumarase/aspartase family protein n=1 Tax=Streptomyces albireticuli TaxID=1940 RepID=UPI0036886690
MTGPVPGTGGNAGAGGGTGNTPEPLAAGAAPVEPLGAAGPAEPAAPAEPVHPLTDSGLLSPVRAGTPAEDATGDRAWLQAMLDAEAALARAQARLGTVPGTAAESVTRAARADLFDPRALALAARETANPVVGLVKALTSRVAAQDPQAAEYVHRGSTSQDILDTATMLVAHRALGPLRADLTRIARALAHLADRHRDTLMAGRTLGLHAVPTTFGLKAAGWRQLVLDAGRRVEHVRRHLPVSLGGAAGTLAGYLAYARLEGTDDPGYAGRLSAAYADETGLARPALPWHTLRTPLADLAAVLSFTTGALGKIATDVLTLTRTEIAELAEPATAGRGASSAMPQKQNPVLATLVRSAALQVPHLAAGLTQSLLSEDERAAGVWQAEWQFLREALRLTGGAAHTAVELAEGLTVHAGRMRENLALTGARIVSERLAAELAPHLGKVTAKALLTAASTEADRSGRPLHAVLADAPELKGRYTEAELAALCDPADHTGAAAALTDRALRP